MYGSVA